MGRKLDLTDKRIGRWTVVHEIGRQPGRGDILWLCRCDCGTEREVIAQTLNSGASRSCGCLAIEGMKRSLVTHGLSGTRLHRIWKNMRRRCLVPNNPRYADYGGRGIDICDAWSDFQAFHDWAVSNGYREDLTIERVDVNGNYEPGNCTWIPRSEQSRNRRTTKRDADGTPWNEIAKANGIDYGNFNQRLRYGMTPEVAATRPIGRWVY